MLKATIKSEYIKDITSALKAMVSESIWKITQDGISTSAVDPANVAMVSLEVRFSCFESYEASESELGIDLTKLGNLLDMAEKDGMVEIELDESAHKLKIQLGELKYTMSLLDPSGIRKSPKSPNIALPGIIEMRGEEFRRAIKAATTVSDYMSIGVDDKTCKFQAEGDTDAVKLELTKDELLNLSNNEKKPVSSLFSLDYLEKIGKSAAKVDAVTINLGQDVPVKIGFKLLAGEVNYMVAPRVESN